MWCRLPTQIFHFFGSQCEKDVFAKSAVFQRFATKTVVFQRVIHILMCFTLLKHAKTVYNTVKACYDAKTVFNTVKAF